MGKQDTEKYWQALKEVMDPEFPISVVDMGLIYNIEKSDDELHVTMTYTAVSCACMEWIEQDIRDRLLKEEEIHDVHIHVVWDPPWTVDRISPEGREKLKYWGVSSA
ncbi:MULTISPECIES: metal-sulfur cluster assembly factor [Geobacillus]|jgi:metal-sulfur cluster biosynthetic enzyme|uniref:Putative benzoyl-CoA oxygenase component B n=2 Tax=Geobacillus thermodenitrificans TaxID=33940 RepID=A4IPJ8_GEOTN|nr:MULTISPECIES: metal-sulfur cluster assembly factor [Geobacillus]ABO67252.1 Putative benzoyl-CoA oxygenase component B [Geobacillus thermodenitrificans NG80-2]ARP43047.1 Putative 1,2-phenylacetyl-CoA epoxidasesubunit D [Geobacillus thermodenitrificans]ATO38895.1 benzoyl-CoA oxygenase [Geobacillus thermodenitrificans]MEC5189732.1 metal-sulfur cluster biosynthetic enzyme [Geobacillus thermodenitrificans]MED0662030.1 metal-sulfur cluster assembly factor [Geobacillus thermodenitrificans]